jgi:putative transposase
MTAVLETSEETKLTSWWLGFSHLQAGKSRIQLPLVPSPYIKDIADASKGILARKTKNGRWRFEVVDKKEWEVPVLPEGSPKVAVDVGLNIMAATSDGRLLGQVKPRFKHLYAKTCALRANRQRQGFKENSPKLNRLESRLTGFVKTLAGETANKLVKAYPEHTFVLEDLDLKGCKGQKRFAYRALQHSLETKAQVLKVNPAYSSQMCPSCGYVSRKNRSGISFKCRSCGRISHADVVGAINLLGRSEDKQIGYDEDYIDVGTILKKRYLLKRNSFSSGKDALIPVSQKLTTRGTARKSGAGIASNQVRSP